MEFRVLGPLEVLDQGRRLPLGGAKPRAVLAVLLLDANRVVSSDRLVADVWGERAPDEPLRTLQVNISHLRKLLEPERKAGEDPQVLVTQVPGYVIRASAAELDLLRFYELVESGRNLLAASNFQRAAETLRAALGLWRGPALADLAYEPFAIRAIDRLEEARLTALEDRIEADVALGQHRHLIAELEELVAHHPLRERLRGQLMVALYRSGRQTHALGVYRDLRTTLVEELGIDPGPELQALEAAILSQDSSLAMPTRPPPATHGANALPAGVVTFLLTDIEGSTPLWEAHAAAMEAALARHDALVAEVVEHHGGRLIKSQGEGDATLSVFPRATDGAAAALALQAAVSTEHWPESLELRVRMALHTGEAQLRDGDYFGATLTRAARLRGLAKGGQVLVSQATAELVVDRLPSGAQLAELGRHTLRGLTRPENPFALTHPDLAATAAPLPIVEVDQPTAAHLADPLPLPARLAPEPGDRFVGRTSEQQVLADALKQVDAERRRRLVLISGEPGIGKTALCAGFAQRAHAHDTVVLYGHCDEGLAIPYQPWAEALGHLVAHGPDALLDALGEKRLGELSRLLPAVTQRRPQLPSLPSTDPEAARYLLYAAAVALLGASGGPLVVILDDLHWADQATLDLLRFLMGAPERVAVLVVGTFRHSELDSSHPLSDVLAALHREPGVQRVTLGGLADVEVIELMEAVAGHALDAEGVALAHALRRETDGNPFFTAELLRHLAETGAIYQQPDGRWSARDDLAPEHLPVSVREVLGHRVARLGDEAERILELAAVIGRSFDLDLLGAVAGVEADELIRVLETASEAALVSELSAQQFAFAHALVQHALYVALSPGRRARAHRRVAEALEQGQHPAAELARHWMAAIVPTDVTKAVTWAQRAGEQALADLAPAEAVHWYSQALELLTQQAAPQDCLHCELMVGLGNAQRQAGDPTYRQTLLEAAHLAQTLGETDLVVAAALANNRGYSSGFGDVDFERVAVLEAALDGVGQRDSGERARLLALLAVELVDAGDFCHRKALADEALAIARRVGDAATFVRSAAITYSAVRAPETLQERLATNREAALHARALGDPASRFWTALPQMAGGLEAAALNEVDSGLSVVTEAANQVGQPFLRFVAAYFGSMRALLAGEVAEAEHLALQALELGSDSGQPDALVVYGAQLAAIRIHQGRVDEIVPLAAQAVADNPGMSGFAAFLGVCFCELDRIEDAQALLAAEKVADFAHPLDRTWLTTTTLWAVVATHLGDKEAVALLIDRLAPWHEQVAVSGATVHGAVALYCGGLARVLGRSSDAESYFAEALGISERLRAPFWEARTKLEWSRLLIDRCGSDDLEGARAQLEDALRLARGYGYGGVERRAVAMLAEVSKTSRTS